jgi:hypothetical protein
MVSKDGPRAVESLTLGHRQLTDFLLFVKLCRWLQPRFQPAVWCHDCTGIQVV